MARTRGCIWLVAGVIVALLAGVVGFVALRGAQNQQAPQAAQAGGRHCQGGDGGPGRAHPHAAHRPDAGGQGHARPGRARGYVADPAQAVGKIATTELAAGEILLASRLVDPDVVAANGRDGAGDEPRTRCCWRSRRTT